MYRREIPRGIDQRRCSPRNGGGRTPGLPREYAPGNRDRLLVATMRERFWTDSNRRLPASGDCSGGSLIDIGPEASWSKMILCDTELT